MVTAAEIEEDHGIPADHITSVSGLNAIIAGRFDTPELDAVHVHGELSDHSTWKDADFFTLKDGDERISCVRFGDGTELHEGDEVLVRGTVDYYREKGEASLRANRVIPVGTGELYRQLRELRDELRQEGLFDGGRPPDRLPERIGLVTSPDADARTDFLDAVTARNELVTIELEPASVQGDDAVEEVTAAISELDGAVDTIVIVRGGGDIEDLRAFNSEAVARAIDDCGTPVITGVGHQEDTTVAGQVADERAMTPTDAGRAATAEIDTVRDQLEESRQRLRQGLEDRQESERQQAEIERRQRRERALVAAVAVLLAVLGGVMLL